MMVTNVKDDGDGTGDCSTVETMGGGVNVKIQSYEGVVLFMPTTASLGAIATRKTTTVIMMMLKV